MPLKKKLWLVLVVILLSTGCSDINYKITIQKDNIIQESLSLIPVEIEKINLTENINFYNAHEGNPVKYEMQELKKGKIKIFANYENASELKYSLFATKFFEVIEINKDLNDTTVIEATKYNSGILNCNNSYNDICYDIDEIKIIINSEYEVLETNADTEDYSKNTFEWILDKNMIDKNIIIKFSDNLRYDVILRNMIISHKGIIIAISAITLSIAIAGLYFYFLYRKVNEI